MTTSSNPEEIRAEIEQTRARLSNDVDALADTANPKNIANRQVDKIKGAARGVKEKLMGADDDPNDVGSLGDARNAVTDRLSSGGNAVGDRLSSTGQAVADRASATGDAVAAAPRRAKQKTRGNPLAAGTIAFGVGLLISGLIPASQKEQRAVADLQRKVEPLKEKATDAAKEVAENLREPAQQAVESVKETAGQAVQNVKDEGASAKDDVQGQVQDSTQTVRDDASR
jgi:gas vesicle protein